VSDLRSCCACNGKAYGVIDDLMIASIIIDVHRNASQGTDFRCEFIEPRVVLPELVISIGSFKRMRT
jgi:hypothetical protein